MRFRCRMPNADMCTARELDVNSLPWLLARCRRPIETVSKARFSCRRPGHAGSRPASCWSCQEFAGWEGRAADGARAVRGA